MRAASPTSWLSHRAGRGPERRVRNITEPFDVCPIWRRVLSDLVITHPNGEDLGGRVLPEGGASMRTYERPTLTKAGSFKKITGLGGRGPRDPIAKHQQL
jgi:hypothetical protein